MAGFTKLFESILDSTIWGESKETRLVWVTMLAMADMDGIVNASVPGLASRAKVSVEEVGVAIKVFMEPDKWSRSKEHEGRRIKEVDGGWELLNHAKYRDKMSPEEIKEKNRIRQAKWRAAHPKEKISKPSRNWKKKAHDGRPPLEEKYLDSINNGEPTERQDEIVTRSLPRDLQ